MEVIRFSRKSGIHPKFSNFADCFMIYGGHTYGSAEAAFQAQKCPERAAEFVGLLASDAKRLGRTVKLREDWDAVKYSIMVDLLTAKFSQNAEFKEELLSTGNAILIEDTTGWHDNIWGSCDCLRCTSIIGQNLLGKALMEVRQQLSEDN